MIVDGLDDHVAVGTPLGDPALRARHRSGGDRLGRKRSTGLGATSTPSQSPWKEFGPCRPKPRDLLVGPGLIWGRQPRPALLIVPNAAPVPPAVDVDLLECGLEVEGCVGVFLCERNLQARQPLPETV